MNDRPNPVQVEPAIETTEDLTGPSVIVEMTYWERNLPFLFNRQIQKGLMGLAIATVVVGAAAVVITCLSGNESPTDESAAIPEQVTITIIATPTQASIIVDGEPVDTNPITLTVPGDAAPHTIVAKAEGHEPLERDLKFNKDQTIRLELIELIAPDED